MNLSEDSNSNPYEPMAAVDEVEFSVDRKDESHFWAVFWAIAVLMIVASTGLLFSFSSGSPFGAIGTAAGVLAAYRGLLARRLLFDHPELKANLFRKTGALFFFESLAIGIVSGICGSIAFVGTCVPTSLLLMNVTMDAGNADFSLAIPIISLLCLILTLWLLRKFTMFTLPKAEANDSIDNDASPS